MNDKNISLIKTVKGKLPFAKSVQEQPHNEVMEKLLTSQTVRRGDTDSVSAQAERQSELESAHSVSLSPVKAAASEFSGAGQNAASEAATDHNGWMDTAAICIGLAAVGVAVVVLSGPLALATAAAGARLAFAGLTSEISEDGLPSVIQKVSGAFVAGAILPYSTTAAVAATVLSEVFTHVSPDGSLEFGLTSKLGLTPLLVAVLALVTLTQTSRRRREAVRSANRHLGRFRRRLKSRSNQ